MNLQALARTYARVWPITLASAFLVLLGRQSYAQGTVASPASATAATATSPAPDAPIVLSPFEVSTNQEKGYFGQDTLAGSRLRTNLKDIAAAISPMTAEFLRDIAVTDVNSAMEYGLGTRVDTDDGRPNPVGDTWTSDRGPQSIRIRGLPGGSRSINFFSTANEVDLYMAGGLEISRGPNSILYGMGSPAGVINVASKQALTDKNAYSFSNRLDSWSGQRWIADANLVPIKNKVGVRAVVLRGREESWRAAGYNDQDRIFLAGKWQIDRRTTVKAEFEHGDIKRFTPRPFFGLDMKSVWDGSGQPIFNNFAASYVPGTPGTGASGTPGNPIRDTGATNVVGVQERSGNDFPVVSDRFPYVLNFRYFTVSESPSQASADFVMGRRNPKAAPEANWVGTSSKVNGGSIFLQRELLRDFNIELAFNRQTHSNDGYNLASWNYYGVSADTNRFLPGGALKPAENLYYFDVTRYHGLSSTRISQGRVTISYEKSLREILTLRVAGLGEMVQRKQRNQSLQEYWLKGPDIRSGGAFYPIPEQVINQVFYRYYIKDLKELDDPNFRIPPPLKLASPMKYQDPRTGALSDIYRHEFNRAQANAASDDRETGAQMGVAQAYLFKNRLVATYGYRQERLKNWVGVAVRDPVMEAVAPTTGIWTPVDPRSARPSIFNGQVRTTGGVFHVMSWLSGFYNQSSSLSIPQASYVTPSNPSQTTADLGRAPSGKTEDYGVKLSLLKNRLFVTATKFHTISKNELVGNTAKGNVVFLWNALATSTALNAEETTMALRQYEVMQQVSAMQQDSESRGYELEIVGQPLPGWSVSANYSKAKSVRSNIGREYRAYLDYWKPHWLKYRNLALGQSAALPRPQYAPSAQDWNTPAVIATTGDFTANTDSINEVIVDAEDAFFDIAPVYEGDRFRGDPQHSINVRTRYDFREGVLKGFSVGGGVRMRKGRVAGALANYDFTSGTDYTDTWNGRVLKGVTTVNATDQDTYDAQLGYTLAILNKKVRWNIQLNVNNLTNQRELIVTNTHPRTLAPTQYRYQDPRQFILTNTFSF